MCDQLQTTGKCKQQLQLIAKSEKSKQLVNKTDCVSSQDSNMIIVPKDSKSEVKSADSLGMETDQTE